MYLKLLPEHLQSIRTHAESTYPEECCGIMLGHIDDDRKTVVEVRATENAWDSENVDATMSKKRRYAIAPIDMLKAQREGRDRNLSIIGIYHSHPDYPAIPSQFDLECAWQQYSYIILCVQDGKAADLASWSLNDANQFQREKIITTVR